MKNLISLLLIAMLAFVMPACVSTGTGDVSPPDNLEMVSGDEVTPEVLSELEGGQATTYFSSDIENPFLSTRIQAVSQSTIVLSTLYNNNIRSNSSLIPESAGNYLWGLRSRCLL